MREVYPFTDVDNGGPIRPERLSEIREQAEFASVTCDSEELLWMLDQVDDAARLRAQLAEQQRRQWYGEQLQMSVEQCSGNHDDLLDYDPKEDLDA